MAKRTRIWLVTCALALLAGCGAPPSKPESTGRAADMRRGGELYQTYCIACHTTQMHWRDKRLVHSWEDLRYQVARWQNVTGQNWSKDEINDVAAYLNQMFYQVPCSLPACGGPSAGMSGERLLAHRP